MLDRLPGAKSAMGAAEQIISMMPAHRVYLEGFGGTGAILLRKRPAAVSLIIAVLEHIQTRLWGPGRNCLSAPPDGKTNEEIT